MIRLQMGTVHAAFVLPASPGMKPHGLVLAETPTDWVTWQVYWDGNTTGDDEGQTHELWEAECGHYFQKSMANNPEMGDPQHMATFDFGLRLRLFMDSATIKGVAATGVE